MAYGSVKMCLQCATCSMVSTCLFRALKFLSCRDSRVKEEACRWPQGKTLRLEIPGARGFTVTGTEKGFRKLPQDTPGDVTIALRVRMTPSAVFARQIGIAQAYAQHDLPCGKHGPGHALCDVGHCGGIFPRGSAANPEAATKKRKHPPPGLPGGAVWEVM
ncbi:MAG: hypothetical protein ACLS43_11515 [Evtepia gabavorous]